LVIPKGDDDARRRNITRFEEAHDLAIPAAEGSLKATMEPGCLGGDATPLLDLIGRRAEADQLLL